MDQTQEEQKKDAALGAIAALIRATLDGIEEFREDSRMFLRISVYARAAHMIELGRMPDRSDGLYDALMPQLQTILGTMVPPEQRASVLKIVKEQTSDPESTES